MSATWVDIVALRTMLYLGYSTTSLHNIKLHGPIIKARNDQTKPPSTLRYTYQLLQCWRHIHFVASLPSRWLPRPLGNINSGIVKGLGLTLCDDDDLLSDHKQSSRRDVFAPITQEYLHHHHPVIGTVVPHCHWSCSIWTRYYVPTGINSSNITNVIFGM